MIWGLWTEPEDAILRQMAAERKSFGDVAKALGRTRNMVAGRARRLGVAFRGPPLGRGVPNARKLSLAEARHLKSMLNGEYGEQAAVARMFGVSQPMVNRIAHGLSWKHA